MENIKKRNIQFTILQSFAIIFVVLGHSGGINIVGEWFPYYSFHMPLFIFISGYFYNIDSEKDIRKLCYKKIKKLVMPYFILNILYTTFVIILQEWGIVNYSAQFNLINLFVQPWQYGNQSRICVASWFVLALFLIQVSYVFLRKVLYFIKINNEYIISFILIILGLISVKIACLGYNTGWYITLIHILFGLPFYHLGYLYKSKLEIKDKLNNCVYFFVLFLIQFALFHYSHGKMVFEMFSANFDGFERNIFIPLLISLTGIMFWLRTSRILVQSLENSRIINFIGKNTWTIMMHHQFIFFIINCWMLIIKNISGKFNGFKYEEFIKNIWYKYGTFNDNKFLLFYAITGIAIPLLIKYYLSKIKDKNKVLKYFYSIF